MIGTTIQLQLNSKKQNNSATQFLPNSISRYIKHSKINGRCFESKNNLNFREFLILQHLYFRNSPAPVVSNLGLLTAPGLSSSSSDTKPKVSATPSTNTNNTTTSSLNQVSLAAFALPAPSKGKEC